MTAARKSLRSRSDPYVWAGALLSLAAFFAAGWAYF